MRDKTNRIVSTLAVLLLATMTGSIAMAEGLDLPRDENDPISLPLSDSASATTELSELLQVFVGSADRCCAGRTPMAGRHAKTKDVLAFSPAFGFDVGQDYVARVSTGQGTRLVPFRIPSPIASVPAEVTQIFPSGDVLPENVLRFYLHFSVPMQPHVAFDFIKLRDASGAVDDAAFMRFKQELWNEDRTRLTVLIDPGRIKRNVATNIALGPALLEGQQYTLTVEAGWPSADGGSVLPAFSKHFLVGAPLRTRPDVLTWEASTPCTGTSGSLNITFDRPFDRHLLSQDVRVTDEGGTDIDGALVIGDGERSLIFTPSAPWSGDEIQVVVGPKLEDVAANNFRDLLDHVSGETSKAPSTALAVRLARCQG